MAVSGKIALVTGGADGIGKAIVFKLLEEQAKGVAILDINEANLKKTEDEIKDKFGNERSITIKCDVTSQALLKEAFQQAKAHFGTLDIVCNNAGIVNEVNWSLMIDVNLKGVMHGTYLAIDMMGTRNGGNGGTVVNMSSVASLRCVPYMAAYTATKHGIRSFSVALQEQVQCKDNGITIKVLCPSLVATRLIKEDFVVDDESEKVFVSAKRDATPKLSTDDVANAFIKLLESKEMILLVAVEGNKEIPSKSFLG
ncbi:15-hydroxyprostaglandin dehydrogenase [NAD(+)]-like [Antedon mediterranea]|uniref:15-hydroxyprostaglandin dehydrogenase [NAD(+)]-like n=1 Tax=Antedon mediterranea TaxID=105859 RepID=UPI003AF464CA